MDTRRGFLRQSAAAGLALGAAGLVPRLAMATTPIWLNTPFHGGDAKAMEILVEKFNEEQDEVRIDLTQGGWTEYYAQLYNAVVAGVAPNIGICHNFRFLSTAPVLYDLADTPIGNVLELGGFEPDAFIEHAWKLCQVDGRQYGIPLDQNMLGLYYNRSIFKEAGLDPDSPPSTREEFEAACAAIKKIGKLPFHPALSGAPRWIRRSWFILFWGLNGKLIENDQAAFNTDAGRESLQYLVDMVHERGWNQPGTDGNKQFLAGELGMTYNGTWFYLTVEDSGVDYGCAEVPQFFDTRTTWGTTHNLVLPKQPDNSALEDKLKASVTGLKLLEANSRLWGEFGGHVPMYKASLESPELRQSRTWAKTLHVFAEMAFGGVFHSEPVHPRLVEFDAAIQPTIQQAYNGSISVKDALDKAEKDANAALKG